MLICIVDFNGSCEGFPTSFWAVWDSVKKEVVFGGDWAGIPNMSSEKEPIAEDIYNWVKGQPK